MKKSLALLIGLFLFAIININAQDTIITEPHPKMKEVVEVNNKQSFKHSLGLAAGFTTGYGLSYRFWPRKFGFQVTFAPFNNDEISQYSAGLTFLFKLAETKNVNLFIYESNHYFYRQEFNYYDNYWYTDNSSDQGGPIRRQINCGAGAGVEFLIGNRMSFNLMVGYAGYNGFDKVNLTGETGLYFRF